MISLDMHFYDNRMVFGLPKESRITSTCVWNEKSQKVKIASTWKAQDSPDLRKVARAVNEALKRVEYRPAFEERESNSQKIVLNEFQIPKFYDNMVQLNQKIDGWNSKVESDLWINFLDVILKFFTFDHYHYKKRLQVPRLKLTNMSRLNAEASSRLQDYIKAPLSAYVAKRRFLRQKAALAIKGPVIGYVAGKRAERRTNSLSYRLWSMANTAGAYLQSTAKTALYQAMRKAPEVIVKQGMKAVAIWAATQAGLNPQDVAMMIRSGDFMDNNYPRI